MGSCLRLTAFKLDQTLSVETKLTHSRLNSCRDKLQDISWYLLGALFKISDEQPHPFFMWESSPGYYAALRQKAKYAKSKKAGFSVAGVKGNSKNHQIPPAIGATTGA